MLKALKLRQAGGSISATLPKDMADRLHLAPGDRVLAVETENGTLLTPYAPRVSSGDFRRPREPARTCPPP